MTDTPLDVAADVPRSDADALLPPGVRSRTNATPVPTFDDVATVPPPETWPGDVEAAVTAYAGKHAEVAAKICAVADPAVEAVGEAREALRQVAAPFREHETSARQKRNVTLTDRGVEEELSTIRQNRRAAVAQQLAPLAQRIAAAEAQYRHLAQIKAASKPEDLTAATDLAGRLRLLTPTHGLPLVAALVRDAAVSKRVGVIHALLPFMRSLAEAPGTAYANHGELNRLIALGEKLLPGWEHRVATMRLEKLREARYWLAAAAQDFDALGALPGEYHALVGR